MASIECKAGILIQIGGSGKRSGKTTLICNLLDVFPGSVAVKLGTHPRSPGELHPDSIKFLESGAIEAEYFSGDEQDNIVAYIASRRKKNVIFLEKNRRIPQINPDLYVFLDTDVENPRPDTASRRAKADIIISNPDDYLPVITAMIRLCKRLRMESTVA